MVLEVVLVQVIFGDDETAGDKEETTAGDKQTACVKYSGNCLNYIAKSGHSWVIKNIKGVEV